MKKTDVLDYFGSASKAAKALRISPAAVSMWPDVLSDRTAYKIELVTNGALKTEETKAFLLKHSLIVR